MDYYHADSCAISPSTFLLHLGVVALVCELRRHTPYLQPQSGREPCHFASEVILSFTRVQLISKKTGDVTNANVYLIITYLSTAKMV